MTIQEAIRSKLPFRLKGGWETVQYYPAGTGPYSNLVIEADYFTTDGELSTSLDLYAFELLSDEWEVLEIIE